MMNKLIVAALTLTLISCGKSETDNVDIIEYSTTDEVEALRSEFIDHQNLMKNEIVKIKETSSSIAEEFSKTKKELIYTKKELESNKSTISRLERDLSELSIVASQITDRVNTLVAIKKANKQFKTDSENVPFDLEGISMIGGTFYVTLSSGRNLTTFSQGDKIHNKWLFESVEQGTTAVFRHIESSSLIRQKI